MINQNKQRAITLTEVLVSLITIIAFIILFIPLHLQVFRPNSRQNKCKFNLEQIGTGLATYVEEHGQGVYYPDTNGGGFVARLYQRNMIDAPGIFLCPSSKDVTDDIKLRGLIAEDQDQINATSYAGRKNKDQKKYPGNYRANYCDVYTSLASDDFQGTKNHTRNIKTMILFHDGQVHFYKNKENQDMTYYFDPLTN